MALFAAGDLLVGRIDTEKERRAPRRPTPIAFPDIQPLTHIKPVTWTESNHPNFFDLRMKWQYVQQRDLDLGPELWKTFNIQFSPVCTPEELLGEKGRPFLPPREWYTEPDFSQRKQPWCREKNHHQLEGQTCDCKLHNGRPWPSRGDFYDRVRDLMYSNKDAFHGYTRAAIDGKPPPRLTYGRPFVEQLDSLVQYWDTSLDQYIPPIEDPNTQDGGEPGGESLKITGDGNEPRKRTKLASDAPPFQRGADVPIASIEQPSPKPRSLLRKLGIQAAEPPPPPPGTYKGWRMDCGSRMPNTGRDLAVKALLDMALWPFGMHVDNHDRSPPRLEVQTLRLSIPLSRRIWRDPLTRLEARSGIVNGPCLATSCRPMTGFEDNDFAGWLDLLRELGALMLLAQERSREGRTEKMPGDGMWWNEKHRWGGMPYEVPGEYKFENGEDRPTMPETSKQPTSVDGSNEKRVLGYTARKEKERNRNREALPGDITIKQRAIHAYKKFAPPTLNWDSKAKYCAVGKEPGSNFDEAFLVSSLNHHISVVKLRVHRAYLEFVETGKFPAHPVSEDWCVPEVSRSRWYDLLDPEDRAEAFGLIWAIGGYLAR